MAAAAGMRRSIMNQVANIAFLRQNAKHSARNQTQGLHGDPLAARTPQEIGHHAKSRIVCAHTLTTTLLICVQKESTKKFWQFGKKQYICRQTQRKHGRVATANRPNAQKRKPGCLHRPPPQENGTRSHTSPYWTPPETRRAMQQENVKLAHASTSWHGRQSLGYMRKCIQNISFTASGLSATSGRGTAATSCRTVAGLGWLSGAGRHRRGNSRAER